MNEISIRLEVGESNKRCYRKQKELFLFTTEGDVGKIEVDCKPVDAAPHEQ